MRVRLCGEVVNNGWAEVYRMFGFDVCCPRDVRDAVERCPAGETLIFEINSVGGSVYAGFEMYSMIRAAKEQTVAEVQGIAASAASVIMAGCDRVLMSPVAEVMIHRATAPAEGNSAVMRQAKQMLDTVDDSILSAYVEKAGGKTEKETFRRMMRNETFLSAQEAIACGLADGMLPSGGEQLSAVRASLRDGAGGAGLPSIDDLLRMAEAAGIQAERDVQDCAAQAAGLANTTTPGARSGGNKEDSMDIKTVDELRQAFPELVAQIENEAGEAATRAERQRIRDIEDMAMPGSEALTEEAKFTKPCSPADYAQAVVKRAKAQGGAWLNAAMRDATQAGAVKTEPVADGGDEFLAAIRAAGATVDDLAAAANTAVRAMGAW